MNKVLVDDNITWEFGLVGIRVADREEGKKVKQRILENEDLRKFVLDLRDNPKPITAEQVLEELKDKTEDLTL